MLPPPPVCEGDTKLCDRSCYNPSTHVCLKFNDGSGGTVCSIGDAFCGGKCLSPSSEKVCVTKTGYDVGGADEEICDPRQELCGLNYCYSSDTHVCIRGNYICIKGESYCGRECYKPSPAVECMVGASGWSFVCQVGEKVCGSVGCYRPEEKVCNGNERDGNYICNIGEKCGN